MSKGIFRKVIIGSLLSVLWAASASAGLLVNGGFEDATGTRLGGGGGWDYYSGGSVSGWEGSNIELWGSLGILDSYEGVYHAELNAHGSNSGAWSISQTFDTTAGQSYELFFAYSARLVDNEEHEEEFRVRVDGLDFNLDDHEVGTWRTHSVNFVADDSSATLNFSSVDQIRWTYGNFLDDVRVTAVPEPGSLALLALGLFGLATARRKAK